MRVSNTLYVKLSTCLLLTLLNSCAAYKADNFVNKQPVAATQPTSSMSLLPPELKPLVQSPQHLIDLLGFHHISAANLPELRAKEQAKGYHPTADIPVSEQWLTGQPGQPDVRVFVINASPAQIRPAILYMHGGGFILGKASDSVVGLQQLAKEHNCVIVSVDYRLAPETRFPGALEDNYTALLWLYQQADNLGVDKNRLVLMGKSAGGGHAAMLAIAARDRGQVPVKQQILIYPMLDDRTGSSQTILESYYGQANPITSAGLRY